VSERQSTTTKKLFYFELIKMTTVPNIIEQKIEQPDKNVITSQIERKDRNGDDFKNLYEECEKKTNIVLIIGDYALDDAKFEKYLEKLVDKCIINISKIASKSSTIIKKDCVHAIEGKLCDGDKEIDELVKKLLSLSSETKNVFFFYYPPKNSPKEKTVGKCCRIVDVKDFSLILEPFIGHKNLYILSGRPDEKMVIFSDILIKKLFSQPKPEDYEKIAKIISVVNSESLQHRSYEDKIGLETLQKFNEMGENVYPWFLFFNSIDYCQETECKELTEFFDKIKEYGVLTLCGDDCCLNTDIKKFDECTKHKHYDDESLRGNDILKLIKKIKFDVKIVPFPEVFLENKNNKLLNEKFISYKYGPDAGMYIPYPIIGDLTAENLQMYGMVVICVGAIVSFFLCLTKYGDMSDDSSETGMASKKAYFIYTIISLIIFILVMLYFAYGALMELSME